MNLVYEILKIRVKIKGKAVVLGIFFACRAEVEFTCDFLEGVNSTSGGMFCDDGGIDFLPSFLDLVYFNNSGLRMISSAGIFCR